MNLSLGPFRPDRNPPAQELPGARIALLGDAKSGREIVDSHSRAGRTNVDAVAAELKLQIRHRPAEATQLTMQALEHLRADDRDELAQTLVNRYNDTELRALGATDAGRGALALCVNELAKGSVHGDEADTAKRVGTALNAEIGLQVNAGWARLSTTVHTVLDIAGFIPGLGAVPDLINAGLYAVQGDWKNAALSATAAVPLGGDAVKGGVLASRAGQAALRHGDELVQTSQSLGRQSSRLSDAPALASRQLDVASV